MRNPSPAAWAIGMTDATVATVSATVSAMYVTTFCERSPKTVGVLVRTRSLKRQNRGGAPHPKKLEKRWKHRETYRFELVRSKEI